MKKHIFILLCALLLVFTFTGCSAQEYIQFYIDAAKTILDENNLDGGASMVFNYNYEGYKFYDLVVTSEDYSDLSNSQKKQILEQLDAIHLIDSKVLTIPEVVSQGYTYSLDYEDNLERDGEIYPPPPTPTPFVMPKGDFSMSWDIYSSEYNSLGGILTITRQGAEYTQKLVMPDGSSQTTALTVIADDDEIRLTDRPGNPFGDYMLIDSSGWLAFYDDQGYIYSKPPLN
jgi:hypothetical protein